MNNTQSTWDTSTSMVLFFVSSFLWVLSTLRNPYVMRSRMKWCRTLCPLGQTPRVLMWICFVHLNKAFRRKDKGRQESGEFLLASLLVSLVLALPFFASPGFLLLSRWLAASLSAEYFSHWISLGSLNSLQAQFF